MIQDFLSNAIQLITLASFVMLLVQFFRFSASHSISVQIHISPATPIAPPAPPFPQQPIAPPVPAPSRWGWTQQASSDDAELVDAHQQFTAAHWAQQKAAVSVPPSTRSRSPRAPRAAAKAQPKAPSTSIQITPAPDRQIILSQCRTGNANNHTHIDINSLPTPLPPDLKIYSVKGRFQGIRVDDLKTAGYSIH